MKEKELITALEKVNAEYLDLIHSREYRLGRQIYKFKNYVKHARFKEMIQAYVRYRNKKKVEKKKIVKPKNIEYANMDNYEQREMTKAYKTVVYTCIVGNYEKLREPYYTTEGFDFIILTDNNITSKIWKLKKIPDNVLRLKNPTLINRYIKMHPYEFFPEYDYSIYVDGKVSIISDLGSLLSFTETFFGVAMHRHTFRSDIYEEVNACIAYGKGNPVELKNQVARYRSEGMPLNFGMLEAAVIVSDMRNPRSIALLIEWWEEFIRSRSMRDQISLPYIIWKNGRNISDIGNLGINVEKNPKFRINGAHN